MSNHRCIIAKFSKDLFVETHKKIVDQGIYNHFRECADCFARMTGPEFAANTTRAKISDVKVLR
jgi:hypothetical protein